MALPYRIGFGYDIHRFASEGTYVVLGGVKIPHGRALDGHSDADCLTHALADAVLGALALPDIGHFFPDDDPAIKGIDSQRILARAVDEARRRGYVIGNVDATLIAEAPRIAPHIDAMKKALGRTMDIERDRIGLKATTNETLGALGSGNGIAAQAVCLLLRGEV